MNRDTKKNTGSRWRSDLRDDEANGHLAAKRAFEGAGVDEEECLLEVLEFRMAPPRGK